MPDYLSCGACHAEFEVVDFYLFLDHKLANCNIRYPSESSNRLSGAESILECSKCLRKCRTPWALLQHLQTEHCLSLARTLLLPASNSASAFLLGGRQRSLVDQNNMSEACTQTTRSCLKRQVCPYEEGLPDDCCLKATKEQRASDSGCCCMDSFGSRGCSGACGNGGGEIDGKAKAKRQSDCCLAVPKKRRILTAAAADATAANSRQIRINKLPASLTADVPDSEGDVDADSCCGLQPDCALLRPPVAKHSAECQTDFVVSLLDDLDVDMLLEDAGVDVPTSLVGDIDGSGSGIASIASIVESSSTMNPIQTSMRRPIAPAPSKAIQTVSRIVCQQPLPLQTPTSQQQQQQQQVILADFYSTESLSYNKQSQRQDEQVPQFQQNATKTASIALSLPPIIISANSVSEAHPSGSVNASPTTRQQQTASTKSSSSTSVDSQAVADSKELRFRCSLCPRTFRQNIHLRKHVMSQHSHSKPHKCPSCDYTTVEKSHLTVHIRKHTGERPFSCRVCVYSTAQNCTLKAHYLRKHPGSVVYCARCQLEFITEHERDKHERSCSIFLIEAELHRASHDAGGSSSCAS